MGASSRDCDADAVIFWGRTRKYDWEPRLTCFYKDTTRPSCRGVHFTLFATTTCDNLVASTRPVPKSDLGEWSRDKQQRGSS